MFSAAVTAADRAVSRSVMAATNCLVSASLGLLVGHHPQRTLGAGDPRRQLAALAGELAQLAQRHAEAVGPALVDICAAIAAR